MSDPFGDGMDAVPPAPPIDQPFTTDSFGDDSMGGMAPPMVPFPAMDEVPAAAPMGLMGDGMTFGALSPAAVVPAMDSALGGMEGLGGEVAPDSGLGADIAAVPPVDDDLTGFFSPSQESPAPSALPAEPSMPDPRIAWKEKNALELKKKAEEEEKRKKEAQAAAKAHTDKFYAAYNQGLKKKAADNRANQKAMPDAGVPTKGNTWEKVNALVNFTATGATKDRDRLKEVLGNCATKNVPVSN